MKKNGRKFSANDRIILKSYEIVIEGLANYLGSSYEIVLHSLEDYAHSVVRIINGYHTGRSVGSPITDLALKMLEAIENGESEESYISYFSTNRQGEPLKSTTIAIRGEKQIIGLICINFYMSTPYIDILKSMGMNQYLQLQSENFADNPVHTIPAAVADARKTVESNRNILPSLQKKAIISILYDQGIFRIKNSVEIVAKELGISINTVYLHLRAKKKEEA